MQINQVQVRSILTRTGGFLAGVTSHSLQPYRGCALGNNLCGVGCYVRGNPWLTRGQPWGSFVEVRTNAAEAYVRQYETERAWGRRTAGRFGIFMSSSTEPFQPAERTFGITRSLLTAMVDRPPDTLIVQTHTDRVLSALDLLADLKNRCDLRVHLSIESDRDTLPGLPPPAASVARRIEAGRRLRAAGVFSVATVAPLLPIQDPDRFFATLASAFDAVVIDHFIGGDGTPDGRRTGRTALPLAMTAVSPESTSLAYRDAMAAVARRHANRVGIGATGFAGHYEPTNGVSAESLRGGTSD